MFIGYARVSTQDQNPALQTDALTKAGCARLFVEKASGAQRDRPALTEALTYMRDGDTLVVWKLDRLARSVGQLVETVRQLEESAKIRGSGWISHAGDIFQRPKTNAFSGAEVPQRLHTSHCSLLRPPTF